MLYQEIEGDLIQLALSGSFNVITHGMNCFGVMKTNISLQMAKTFKCDQFELEYQKGDINKLGQIDCCIGYLENKEIFMDLDGYYRNEDSLQELVVVNSYTQYNYGKMDGVVFLDYEALTLCMRKINHAFKGKHIGLPVIGCGLAGAIWDYRDTFEKGSYEYESYSIGQNKDVKTIIQEELKDCDVTIVHYKK